jgi:hypothetical protein
MPQFSRKFRLAWDLYILECIDMKRKLSHMKEKMSDKVDAGYVMQGFTLTSPDEDGEPLSVSKKFADGSEWSSSVIIDIPNLFRLFRAEGVDPCESTTFRFEFKKAKLRIGYGTETLDGEFVGVNCYSEE